MPSIILTLCRRTWMVKSFCRSWSVMWSSKEPSMPRLPIREWITAMPYESLTEDIFVLRKLQVLFQPLLDIISTPFFVVEWGGCLMMSQFVDACDVWRLLRNAIRKLHCSYSFLLLNYNKVINRRKTISHYQALALWAPTFTVDPKAFLSETCFYGLLVWAHDWSTLYVSY